MTQELNFSLFSNSLPPQNVDAEESILGGILLDPDAIGRVADILTPEAFYINSHKDIYKGALLLHTQGQPTDLMSVASWLNDQELLERVGGTAKLAQLVDRTVSAVNIDRYAKLVVEKHLRRQLIQAGNEIVQLGYDTALELETVFDQSEQKIFGLTQQRPQQGLTPISETLIQTFQEIETRHDGVAIPGLPTNFYDLDAMTGGFQRSDLIVIAGRPSMGKTSFAMAVARNIAEKMPVAIFSLEMSREQLVQRMLASEAGIESNYLRTGRISQNQWEPLSYALGSLSDLPIYIDDTPNQSVMQMRSQARRLQAEHGDQLGLILIDYLQLMEGSGSENRVQEISRITRSLKGLGRELNVPVIALSQLSRGVEARTNKRPMMSDLRESGCLTGDTLVIMADTGTQVPIRELVGRKDFSVWALDQSTMKLARAQVSNAFSTGVKSVQRMTTHLGRTIRATGNHQFLTTQGWRRLDELKIGDRVALPRQIINSTTQTISNAELALYRDIIERTSWQMHAIPAMKVVGLTTRQLHAQLGNAYCGSALFKQNLSREPAEKLATIVQSQELRLLAKSDVYWDKIQSIEPDGIEEVFDLTIPHFHNFVANNIVVHNSIEQDADLIIMLYRDEYYSPDTPDRGIAEVIVTKHRNGPTGMVKLIFDPQFTRFRNLASPNR